MATAKSPDLLELQSWDSGSNLTADAAASNPVPLHGAAGLQPAESLVNKVPSHDLSDPVEGLGLGASTLQQQTRNLVHLFGTASSTPSLPPVDDGVATILSQIGNNPVDDSTSPCDQFTDMDVDANHDSLEGLSDLSSLPSSEDFVNRPSPT